MDNVITSNIEFNDIYFKYGRWWTEEEWNMYWNLFNEYKKLDLNLNKSFMEWIGEK